MEKQVQEERRKVEFTEVVTKISGEEYFEGEIKFLPKALGDICVDSGWAKC